MKYYYPEHLSGYQKVKTEGKTAWGEIHGSPGFGNFASRAFLESALPTLCFSVPRPVALEIGCGTGPGACFLAERGFRVHGIDIIPLAIEMARELARERNLDIHFEVQDVCELPLNGVKYDMIVDSYCLQCIATGSDRQQVFSAVRARLKSKGYYLVSTAMFDESRFHAAERICDAETGVVYHGYGEDIINPETRIVYSVLEGKPTDYEAAIHIGGTWFLPNRRHWNAAALRAELEAAGFRVIYQGDGHGGNVICVTGVDDNGTGRFVVG